MSTKKIILLAAAPVQAEQPAVVQEVWQQEITEVLPMRHEAVPIPVIPQVLQRRAEPTLDKALGTEADYESLRSLFYDEMYEEERDGEMLRFKGLIAFSDYEFEKKWGIKRSAGMHDPAEQYGGCQER